MLGLGVQNQLLHHVRLSKHHLVGCEMFPAPSYHRVQRASFASMQRLRPSFFLHLQRKLQLQKQLQCRLRLSSLLEHQLKSVMHQQFHSRLRPSFLLHLQRTLQLQKQLQCRLRLSCLLEHQLRSFMHQQFHSRLRP